MRARIVTVKSGAWREHRKGTISELTIVSYPGLITRGRSIMPQFTRTRKFSLTLVNQRFTFIGCGRNTIFVVNVNVPPDVANPAMPPY